MFFLIKRCCASVLFFFFFQAEDGIRDATVTGVQTCALPISFKFWPAWHIVPGMSQPPDISAEKTEAFITRWQGQEGGQERANYALFLTELCDGLGLPHPDPADARHERNDYVFERVVTWHRDDGDAIGRIDLYRKN